jgi:hypothetical protein
MKMLTKTKNPSISSVFDPISVLFESLPLRQNTKPEIPKDFGLFPYLTGFFGILRFQIICDFYDYLTHVQIILKSKCT